VIPQSEADIRFWRERLERELDALATEGITLDDPLEQVGMTAFHLAYHGLSDRHLQENIARFYLEACPDLAWTASHCRPGAPRPSRDGRYRIGIVTAYLRYHTIAKVNRGLIRHLDRERFDVTVFHLGPEDAWTAEIAASADRAVRLPRTLAGMRETIAAEQLDLLFNIDAGMHAATTFLAYARLAPVQCVSWGHPVTTGIRAQDWYISAADLEPDGSEAEYTERLVRFDRLPTFYLRPDVPAETDRERFGFIPSQRLYVCPQLLFKLHPSFDAVLADILRRDPAGIVVLLEGVDGTESPRQRLVRERFGRANPDVADRLVFRPFLDADAFIALLAVADVLLDPPWFGGGNTSLEAFAVGTPIVTWPGPFARGRTTFAGLKRMGVLDGVVETLDDYADRAVRIATDPALREDIRQRIVGRNHLIYEDPGVIREFETFFARAIDAARLEDHA
jgi:protein O-GlcNAc transferase